MSDDVSEVCTLWCELHGAVVGSGRMALWLDRCTEGAGIVQTSVGNMSQKEVIKKIVECACMHRAANITHSNLEDKEIFLTRMHAKVQTGKVALPADVISEADMRATQ